MPGGWRRLGLATLAGLFITMAAACGYYGLVVLLAVSAMAWSWHDITRYTTTTVPRSASQRGALYRGPSLF